MTGTGGPQAVRRRRRVRWLVAGAAALAVLGTGTAVVLARLGAGSANAAPPGPAPAATAEVVRTDLAEQQTIDGTLGYGVQTPLSGRRPGTVTWLPSAGTVIERGKAVYTVDAMPVPLFYGGIPLYRELKSGVDKGPDVKVIEENLAALGFTGFGRPDETYTEATANAVRRWQKSLGLPQTGTVSPGDVVVRPGAIRVASVSAQPGTRPETELMKVTGTVRQVTVQIAADKQSIAKPGSKVQVEITGGGSTGGTVTAVDSVSGSGGADGGNGRGGGGDGSGSGSTPKVAVTIALDDPKVGDGLDSAPASVRFTSGSRQGVLAVPVGALLALAEGGYAVEVLEGDRRRLVAVRTGLFQRGMVEVTGDLRPGQRVVTTS